VRWYPENDETLLLELSSPSGHAVFRVWRETLTRFLVDVAALEAEFRRWIWGRGFRNRMTQRGKSTRRGERYEFQRHVSGLERWVWGSTFSDAPQGEIQKGSRGALSYTSSADVAVSGGVLLPQSSAPA